MMYREGEAAVSTPACAREVARRALQSAEAGPADRFWSLITARVFTAFMLEGAIHHLGATLRHDWDSPQPRPEGQKAGPPLSREPMEKKHKLVRKFLGLDNSAADYQSIRDLLDDLVAFRDAFAHPKQHVEKIDGEVATELDPIPQIAWERDIELGKVRAEFEKIESYCVGLLDVAAETLEKTYQEWWNDWRQKYPHLKNPELEAAYLRTILHTTHHSSSNYYR